MLSFEHLSEKGTTFLEAKSVGQDVFTLTVNALIFCTEIHFCRAYLVFNKQDKLFEKKRKCKT